MFKKLLGKKGAKTSEEHNHAAENQWYADKSVFMASVLGKEHGLVQHALLPFAVGGALDLYYYPNGLPGTGIATKELIDFEGNGPANREFPCYELVMFTRHDIDLENAHNEDTPFGKAHQNIADILNRIARYSTTATLNPGDTIEFPADIAKVGGKCLFMVDYSNVEQPGPKGMGLMLVMEVFRSEMEYSRQHGSAQLYKLLKRAGCFPYSDLERDPAA
jgi:hypothetical protein